MHQRLRMSKNLGHNIVVTICFCLLASVPYLNLLILFVLNQRAVVRIKEAGIEVGLFGAKT